ncbi:MAG: hypothetical protein AB1545_13550 [Thermodesulfobacteriota bacterium]
MIDTIAFIIFLIISFSGSYLLLRFIYGDKDPRKWKSVLYPKENIDENKDKNGIPSKNSGIFKIIVPLIVTFVFAILYNNIFENRLSNYIKFGVGSVMTNIIISALYCIYYKKDLLSEFGSYAAATVALVTLIIPFIIYYILITFVISGFSKPFI